jgi:hypothetical protein
VTTVQPVPSTPSSGGSSAATVVLPHSRDDTLRHPNPHYSSTNDYRHRVQAAERIASIESLPWDGSQPGPLCNEQDLPIPAPFQVNQGSWPPISVNFLGDQGTGKTRLLEAFSSVRTSYSRPMPIQWVNEWISRFVPW